MFPGRFKWEKTHSGSGHIIPQVSGAGLKKRKRETKTSTRIHSSLLSWLRGSACGKHQSRNGRLSGEEDNWNRASWLSAGRHYQLLGTPVRKFLYCVNWGGQTDPKYGYITPWAGFSDQTRKQAEHQHSFLCSPSMDTMWINCSMFLPCHLLRQTSLNLWVQTHPSFCQVWHYSNQKGFIPRVKR